MTICWERPVSDGGSSIAGYVIEKREKTGLRWCRVNKKPVYDLRVKASHLREGCEYEYRVFAENAAGLSAPSTPCPLTRAEDPQFLPSPPAKPRIIDSTKTTVTLSWNKPLFDGGAPVTGYRVEYRKTLDDEWIVGVQNTKNTEFTVVGLSPGTEYVFVVKSINKIGVSEPSPESDKQVAKEREEEPTFDVSNEMRKTLIVKDGSSFTMKVPFKGKPIPSVTWAKPDVDLRVRAVIDTTDTFSSITLEKATRDDSGKYTVTLSNVAGTSSLTLNVRVLDSPGPPSHIEVKEVTKTSATITWDTPEIEGGGPVKNYLIDYREASKKGWSRLTDTCHRLTYKVADLQEGEGRPTPNVTWRRGDRNMAGDNRYTVTSTERATTLLIPKVTRDDCGKYMLEIENGVGEPKIVTVSLKVLDSPSTCQKLMIKNVTRGKLTLSWEPPLIDGGSPVTNYIVEKKASTMKIRFRTTDNKTSVTVRGVKKEHAGQYTLVLDNRVIKNYFDINVITLGPPSVPTGPIRFDEIKAQTIIISWDEPKEDGGGEITCYSVEKRETSQANWKMVCSSVVRTTFKIPNLVKGTQYQFRVRAENKYGVSEPLISSDVVAQHQYKPPGPPGKPVAYNITSDGMSIKWDAPEFDGGSPVLGYHVEKKDRNSLLWQKVNSTTISNREYRIIGLVEGLEYSFRVYAENNAGFSPCSEQSKHALAISPVEEPAPPKRLDVVDTTNSTASLVWLKPEHDGGSRVRGYIVELRKKERNTILWVRENKLPCLDCQYKVSNLIEGLEYQFRVYAMNLAGLSKASEASRPVVALNPVGGGSIYWYMSLFFNVTLIIPYFLQLLPKLNLTAN
uniref:Titin n=1 Tax=Neolamprologus brichardi TaxID=32507 RepID=A0A3Q4HDV3_NEOBR